MIAKKRKKEINNHDAKHQDILRINKDNKALSKKRDVIFNKRYQKFMVSYKIFIFFSYYPTSFK